MFFKQLAEVGDKHAQESPAMLSLSVLLFRWHNYVVDHFVKDAAYKDFDEVFAEARKWVIASLQVRATHQMETVAALLTAKIWLNVDLYYMDALRQRVILPIRQCFKAAIYVKVMFCMVLSFLGSNTAQRFLIQYLRNTRAAVLSA